MTMTDQPTQDAIVSQRDREAAAALRSWLPPLADGREIAAMRDGRLDDGAYIQAFATYRAEIEAATIERCAAICDERVQILHDLDGVNAQERVREADLVRKRVRNLKAHP